MPAKPKDDDAVDPTKPVPVQGAEPTISKEEAAAIDKSEREGRAARARADDQGTTTTGGLSVGATAAAAATKKASEEKVMARRPIIDPSSQQLVGYDMEEVTRAEADAGLSATTPRSKRDN